MKECLDYIKENGIEIQKLNNEIKKEMQENKVLRSEIDKLKTQLAEKDAELRRIRDLANKWYYEYEEIMTKYDNLESLCDAMSVALSQIAPKLYKEIEDEITEAKNDTCAWMEIGREYKRSRW